MKHLTLFCVKGKPTPLCFTCSTMISYPKIQSFVGMPDLK